MKNLYGGKELQRNFCYQLEPVKSFADNHQEKSLMLTGQIENRGRQQITYLMSASK